MAIYRNKKIGFALTFVVIVLIAGFTIGAAYEKNPSDVNSSPSNKVATVRTDDDNVVPSSNYYFERYPSSDAFASSVIDLSHGDTYDNNSTTNSGYYNYLSLPDLFDKSQVSVVQILDRAGSGRLGSGFVFDESGHIITNYHVISGGGPYDVTFSDGTIYRAKLVGTDAYSDLAVLLVSDVPDSKLIPLPLANSDKVRIGEQVIAIGNPFGLSGTMTTGIVSGLGRLIPAQSPPASPSTTPRGSNNNNNVFSIPNVIQTDAAINPGNSGGPLLNREGKVIGVTSAIYSTTGQFSGVGFALPSNTVSRVVSSIIQTGSFKHPWLGISGTNITPAIAKALDLSEPRGFLVVDVVSGSPAEKAGVHGGNKRVTIDGRPMILGGDVIIRIDNTTVRKIDDVLVYLDSEKTVGDKVKLVVIRDNKVQEIVATLGSRPGSFESP